MGRPRKTEAICIKCGETDPTEFYYNRTTGRPLNKCKKCNNKRSSEQNRKNNRVSADKHKVWREARPDYQRNYHLASKYDLSPEEYQSLFEAQFGLCAICGEAPKNGRFHIDHCHSSGVIRGLLCTNCNLMLGNARDRIDVLTKATKYLKKHLT